MSRVMSYSVQVMHLANLYLSLCPPPAGKRRLHGPANAAPIWNLPFRHWDNASLFARRRLSGCSRKRLTPQTCPHLRDNDIANGIPRWKNIQYDYRKQGAG